MKNIASMAAVALLGCAGVALADTPAPHPSFSADQFSDTVIKGPGPCPAGSTRADCENSPKTRRWTPFMKTDRAPALVKLPARVAPAAGYKGGKKGHGIVTPQAPVAAGPIPSMPDGAPTATPTDASLYVRTLSTQDILVTFKVGSADLTLLGRVNLDVVAQALNGRLSGLSFELAGYTDISGADDMNMALSVRRAEAVKAYLISKGVDGTRLKASGYGETHLRAPEDPLDEINRRVEILRLN